MKVYPVAAFGLALSAAALAAGATATVNGDDAATFAAALADAGVPSRALADGGSELRADAVRCVINGSTAGNIQCTADAAGETFALSVDGAATVLRLLSKNGGQHGGAHAPGGVYATATQVLCQLGSDLNRCTWTVE